MESTRPNLLFIINPGSGNNATDWRKEIATFFKDKPATVELHELPVPCELKIIKDLIMERKPTRVIAVGGDGTVKLLAECLVNTLIPLGILPGGSANGMAKELDISDDPQTALETIMGGTTRRIHLVKINEELSIHLSDIGFNAFVVKKFEEGNKRGMWGYVKAAWKVLRQHSEMQVELKINNEFVTMKAVMVVIANATRYGNGVVINPAGSLFDDLFEVVIIKKISFREIFKMRFTQKNFDHRKTTLRQTRMLRIESVRKAHFQVDGEYRGKVNKIKAEIISDALSVIVPIEKVAQSKLI
jgi:diacylglycerol kinase (ATP)